MEMYLTGMGTWITVIQWIISANCVMLF